MPRPEPSVFFISLVFRRPRPCLRVSLQSNPDILPAIYDFGELFKVLLIAHSGQMGVLLFAVLHSVRQGERLFNINVATRKTGWTKTQSCEKNADRYIVAFTFSLKTSNNGNVSCVFNMAEAREANNGQELSQSECVTFTKSCKSCIEHTF